MKIMAILFTILFNLKVEFACIDNEIDARFNNIEDAKEYKEYFKDHHSYNIQPIITLK
jgi:hypothetical protein